MKAKRPRDEDDEADEEEEEASFDDDDSDDDDSDEGRGGVGDDDDDDDDDDSGGRKPSVNARLRRIKTTYPADRERTLEWALARAGEAEEALGKEQYALADLEQPASLTCTLKGYQLDGLRWLAALHACGRSGILADEMGLGKTAQAIAMLALLRSRGVSGPFLVIAPLSTLSGWLEQLRSFCPSLHVTMYTGSATERAAVRRGPLSASSVLLASYEPVLADAPALVASCRFGYAVLDEAHRLKSRTSAVYRCLLDELKLGAVPRLLLTGTPLQNRADELFSLLHFCAPDLFDDAEGFSRWAARDAAAAAAAAAASASSVQAAGAPSAAADDDATAGIASGGVHTAGSASGGVHTAGSASGGVPPPPPPTQRLWRPFMLRRLKAEHLHLPPKREVTIRVPMTSLQRHWYRAVLEKNRRALGGGANARSLVNVLAALRKCCNHPYLFEGVEPEPFEEGEHLVHAAAKLRLLDRLLVRLWARGARVLLFSQSTMMLDVLQDYLHLRRWAYERLDGSARAEERWTAVAAFSGPVNGGAGGGSRAGGGGGPGRETEPFIFLLSTRAGGLGLNLVAANTVIFYDHDWNPQADAQATDRVHRLGQTRPVLVVRLVCAGTVEEVILRRAQAKLLVSRGLLAEHAADLDVPAPSAAGSGAGAGRSAGVGVSAAGAPSQAAAAEAIRFGLASLCNPPEGGGTSGRSSVGGDSDAAGGPSDAAIEALLDGGGSGGGGSGGGGSGGGGSGGGGRPSGLSSGGSAVNGGPVGAAADGDIAGAGAGAGVADSIYIFDGVDFAAKQAGATKRAADDEAAFSAFVQRPAGASGAASGMGIAPDALTSLCGRGRRNREPMDEEESAAELARLAAATAAAEAAKKEKAEARKRERWRKAGYTSLALRDVTDQLPPAAAPATAAAPPGRGGKAVAGRTKAALKVMRGASAWDGSDTEDDEAEAAVTAGVGAAALRAQSEAHEEEGGDEDEEGDVLGGDCNGTGVGAAGRGRRATISFMVGDAMTGASPLAADHRPGAPSQALGAPSQAPGAPSQALDAPSQAPGAPSPSASASAPPRVVVAWVDTSGRWPSRGFFRSISAVSDAPQAVYEAAHAQADLELGDAHLVDCSSAATPGLHVCLLVVLHRDKRAAYGTPPSLDTVALDTALCRLATAARQRAASVHSPRLSANGSSWYAVERLLRKNMRGVPTSIYYFKR